MKIAFVYTKGRPLSITSRTFDLRDFGGTEASMIRYAQALASLGHEVTIYTSGAEPQCSAGVEWRDLRDGTCYNQTFDVALAVRFPVALTNVDAALRVLFCHDPEIPELPRYVAQGTVNLVIVVSQHQKQRFQEQHPIEESLYLVTNSGLAYTDYARRDIPKMPGRCIFCSVPLRGLKPLVSIWPMIRKELPWATLHITGGFALWGIDVPPHKRYVLLQMMALGGVTSMGILPRKEFIEEQLRSQVLLLPGDIVSLEMCCVSAMECAAARNVLVVGDPGALPERVLEGQTGYIVGREEGWHMAFAQKAVEALTHPQLEAMQELAREEEREHDYAVLAPQWIERFEKELSKH